jgi:hypothetical protein
MAKRFIGSGRLKEGGFLAVHKQDFNVHYRGEDFRHGAPDIDMEPPLTVLNNEFYHPNVQGTLELLADYVSKLGGGSFVSIGTTDNPGDFNAFTTDYPTFKDAFDAAAADTKLLNGGWILVKAGKYAVVQTITVPNGISVMGEVDGTIIVGETSENPIFLISENTTSTTIGGDSGGGELDLKVGEPGSCKFINLIIADNLDGNVTSGGDPISTMTTVPMIQCEVGSDLTCDYVKFIGRINYGAVAGRAKTLRAVGYTGVSARSSHLRMRQCFFDAMQIAVDFSPGNGDIDFLTVDSCRARTFGVEDGVSIDPALNSFVTFSLCNATLTNNYHVGFDSGGNSTVRYCYYLSTLGAGGTDVRLALSGNSGTPSSSLPQNKSTFFVNVVEDVIAVQTGNNWGNTVHNDWYVVVGGDSIDNPSGDFFGPNAIDLLLNINVEYPTTVIVNTGTYTVTTGVGGKNYSFIGNKSTESSYPILSLNISSVATDLIGNRFFSVGSYLKSIRFQTDGASANFHSVNVNLGQNSSIYVDDCSFEDCTLYVEPMPAPSIDDRKSIIVNNCNFYKQPVAGAPWNDNMSLLLPTADEVLVQKCVVRGGGYVGGIGQIASIGYVNGGVYDSSNIILRDCVLNLAEEPISQASPIADHQHYFFIDDASNNVHAFMDNCQISVTSDFTALAPVNPGLTIPGGFEKFVLLQARDLLMLNCRVNGPYQKIIDAASGDEFVLPSLFVAPLEKATVSSSRFLNCIFPLQFGGSNVFSLLPDSSGLNIVGNDFITRGASGGAATGENLTMLDVDISFRSQITPDDFNPCINIYGNNFISSNYSAGGAGTTLRYPSHTENITNYSGVGVVQVYAEQCKINFSENQVECNALQPMYVTSLTTIDQYTGVYLDNYTSAFTDGRSLSPIFVSNNNITVVNVGAGLAAPPPNSAESLIVSGSVLLIQDNLLNMQNDEGVASAVNFGVNNILIDNQPSTLAGAYSEALVCGNMFSRRDRSTHSLVDLKEGYIQVTAASGSGWIKDNTFDDRFFEAGGDVGLVQDFSSSWVVERNKNQTDYFNASVYHGMWGSGDNGATPAAAFVFGDTTFAPAFNVASSVVASSNTVTLFANVDLPILQNVSNSPRSYYWALPLNEALPYNTYVVAVRQNNLQFTTNTPGQSLGATLKLATQGEPTLTNTIVVVSPAFGSLSVVPGNKDYIVNSVQKPYVVLQLDFPGTDPVLELINFELNGYISIEYAWL